MSEQEKILEPAIEKPAVTQPASVEVPKSPEVVVEGTSKATAEKTSDFLITPATNKTTTSVASSPEVERQVEIERILEDDLSTVYFNLPEDKKEEFRIEGEKAAFQINQMLSSTKIKVQKIIKLIKNWLLLIPGVNRFFLEQEAKLKADEIIKLNDKF